MQVDSPAGSFYRTSETVTAACSSCSRSHGLFPAKAKAPFGPPGSASGIQPPPLAWHHKQPHLMASGGSLANYLVCCILPRPPRSRLSCNPSSRRDLHPAAHSPMQAHPTSHSYSHSQTCVAPGTALRLLLTRQCRGPALFRARVRFTWMICGGLPRAIWASCRSTQQSREA